MRQSNLKLSFERIDTWTDAQELMRIRNQCREGMTHDTSVITEKQQYEFYKDHLAPWGDQKYEAYLLMTDEKAIGFGLLKWDEEKGHYWMTAGLIKEYRGKGLSRLLINFITEMGHREGADVWIDVWEDNLALIGDIKVGYEVMDQKFINGKVLNIMKHNRERQLRLGEIQILKNFTNVDVKSVREFNDIRREIEGVDAISRQAYS